MSVVYVGIGSNLGNRQKNIDTALQKLRERKNIEVKELSSIIETEPVGDTQQPKFLNAVFKIETILYPDELLAALQSIEKELGRDRSSEPARLTTTERLKMLEEGNLELVMQAYPPAKKTSEDKDQQERWGPRTIDLDILFYDDIVIKGNSLIIPHPRLQERLFVLEPLAEIAPDFLHPVIKKTIKELLLEYKAKSEGNKDSV